MCVCTRREIGIERERDSVRERRVYGSECYNEAPQHGCDKAMQYCCVADDDSLPLGHTGRLSHHRETQRFSHPGLVTDFLVLGRDGKWGDLWLSLWVGVVRALLFWHPPLTCLSSIASESVH